MLHLGTQPKAQLCSAQRRAAHDLCTNSCNDGHAPSQFLPRPASRGGTTTEHHGTDDSRLEPLGCHTRRPKIGKYFPNHSSPVPAAKTGLGVLLGGPGHGSASERRSCSNLAEASFGLPPNWTHGGPRTVLRERALAIPKTTTKTQVDMYKVEPSAPGFLCFPASLLTPQSTTIIPIHSVF